MLKIHLNQDDLKTNQEVFVTLLRNTHRKGFDRLYEYLKRWRFEDAPSSIDRHHCWRGGLVQHSLGTYVNAVNQNGGKTDESIVVAALLHDLCKFDVYDINHQGIIKINPLVTDQRHSSKSVSLLRHMNFYLSEGERRAIRWHMKNRNSHVPFKDREDFQKAVNERLWKIIYSADKMDATHPVTAPGRIILSSPHIYMI